MFKLNWISLLWCIQVPAIALIKFRHVGLQLGFNIFYTQTIGLNLFFKSADLLMMLLIYFMELRLENGLLLGFVLELKFLELFGVGDLDCIHFPVPIFQNSFESFYFLSQHNNFVLEFSNVIVTIIWMMQLFSQL